MMGSWPGSGSLQTVLPASSRERRDDYASSNGSAATTATALGVSRGTPTGGTLDANEDHGVDVTAERRLPTAHWSANGRPMSNLIEST